MESMKRKLLPLAIMAAHGIESASSGKTLTDADKAKAAEFAEATREGKQWADKVIEGVMKSGEAYLNLFTTVAETDSLGEANAFIEAYRAECKRRANGANLVEIAAANTAAQRATEMQRVAYSVHGKPRKNEAGTAETWYGNMKDKKATHIKGQKAVLALLRGPGSWMDKIGSLPTFTNAGRTRANNNGELPIQNRIKASAELPPQGNAEAFVNLMNVPAKAKGKELSQSKREELALGAMLAGIRASTAKELPLLLSAIINRCRVSDDKDLQHFAAEASKINETIANLADQRTMAGNAPTKARRLVKSDKVKAK